MAVNITCKRLWNVVIDLELVVTSDFFDHWLSDRVVKAVIDWRDLNWDWLVAHWRLFNLLALFGWNLHDDWLSLEVLWWGLRSLGLVLLNDLLGLHILFLGLKSLGVSVHLPMVVKTRNDKEEHNWAHSAAFLALLVTSLSMLPELWCEHLVGLLSPFFIFLVLVLVFLILLSVLELVFQILDLVLELTVNLINDVLCVAFIFVKSLGVTLEDGSWEILGIVNTEAAAWYGRAFAPDASRISIASTFGSIISSALIGCLTKVFIPGSKVSSLWLLILILDLINLSSIHLGFNFWSMLLDDSHHFFSFLSADNV